MVWMASFWDQAIDQFAQPFLIDLATVNIFAIPVLILFTLQWQRVYRHASNVALYTDVRTLAGTSVAFLILYQLILRSLMANFSTGVLFPCAALVAYAAGLWAYWYQTATPSQTNRSIIAPPANPAVLADKQRRQQAVRLRVEKEYDAVKLVIDTTYPQKLFDAELNVLLAQDPLEDKHVNAFLETLEKRHQLALLVAYYDQFLVNDASYPHSQFQAELDRLKESWDLARYLDEARKIRHRLEDHVKNRGKGAARSVDMQQFQIELRRAYNGIKHDVEQEANSRGVAEPHLIQQQVDKKWSEYLAANNMQTLFKKP